MTSQRAQQLVFRRCRFRQPVRLADFASGPELVFVDCYFERGVRARDAVLERSLSFVHCDFGSPGDDGEGSDIALDLENARIRGDVTLFDCCLGGRLFARRLRTEGSVRLRGIQIAPSLEAIPEPIRSDEIGGWHEPPPGNGPTRFHDTAALLLDHAEIGADLEVAAAGREDRRTSNVLEAIAAADWSETQAAAASLIAGAMSCALAEVGGNVLLIGAIVLGDARFEGVRVRGACHLSYYGSWTQFRTLEQGTLSFMNAVIEGACSLTHARIDGDVSFYGATINGYINLLGMSVGDTLNFNFATTRGYVHAFRHHTDRVQGRRHSLFVGGELLMSGADMRSVELRGAVVQKEIAAIGSKFGRLFLTWGAEPAEENSEHVWPRPCEAARVVLSAITVEESLDVSGIRVRGAERQQDANQPGFLLQNSNIGISVRFFTPSLATRLVERWGDLPPWPRAAGDGKELDEPRDSAFRAYVAGGLDLRANVIGGHLDLRNVEVHGPIRLNDTSVRLDVEIGWRSEGPKAGGALVTACGHFDGEKLQCEGDVDLTGLLVAPELWREDSLSAEERIRRGTFIAREARVRGQLLFLPSQDVRRLLGAPDMDTPADEAPIERKRRRPWYAYVGGRATHGPILDLTAATASHLVISGLNVPEGPSGGAAGSSGGAGGAESDAAGEHIGISLERASVSRLGIVEPTYDYIDLSNVEVSRWVFGDKDEPEPEDFVKVLQHMKPFDRRTWVAVETMFRNEAKEDEASYIYRMMRLEARDRLGRDEGDRRRHRRSTERGRIRQAFGRGWWHVRDRVVAWTTSYGTRVYPLMILWAAFFAISLFVFSDPRNVGATTSLLEIAARPATLEPAVAASAFESPEASVADFANPTDWGLWDSLGLTLRYQVPIVPLAIHERWEASRRPLLPGFTAEHYALLAQVVSWVALPVLLIYLATGVVRGRR